MDGERGGLVDGVGGFFVLVCADVDLGEAEVDVTVFRAAGSGSELGVGEGDSLLELAGVGELRGVHELNLLILGEGVGRVGGGVGGFLPHVRVAVGVDLALVAALGVVGAAEVEDLLIGGYGFGGLVLLAIDDAEAVEEDGAVGLLGIGVFSVGMGGAVEEFDEDCGGLVVASEGVVDEGFVIGELERVGLKGLGLLDGFEGGIVVALAALNLGDVNHARRRPEARRRRWC